jgi:hypothetical protein
MACVWPSLARLGLSLRSVHAARGLTQLCPGVTARSGTAAPTARWRGGRRRGRGRGRNLTSAWEAAREKMAWRVLTGTRKAARPSSRVDGDGRMAWLGDDLHGENGGEVSGGRLSAKTRRHNGLPGRRWQRRRRRRDHRRAAASDQQVGTATRRPRRRWGCRDDGAVRTRGQKHLNGTSRARVRARGSHAETAH